MDFRTPSNFQAITRGRWLVPPRDDSPTITGFSFDTRSLKPGDLFLAIRGESGDGHQHVRQAIELGAAMVMVQEISDFGFRISDLPNLGNTASSPSANPKSQIRNPKSEIEYPKSIPIPLLLVPDTVLALQRIAAAWRTVLGEHGVKVIAVTGSNGKTTTRNMIHCALSSSLRGTQSPKSFNNHLGVPLTLLAASTEDDFVVAEAGTNHPGEIATLADILRPHIAVITNIGTAHIGMFGDKEAIAAEKGSLLRFIEPGGRAIVRCAEPYAMRWRSDVVPRHARVISFGRHENATVRITEPVTVDEGGLHFRLINGIPIDLPLLGEHNIDNALAAVAVARAMGIEDVQSAAALSKLAGVEMRMQIVKVGRGETGDEPALTVINDAYNANPDSMAAGIGTLASLPVSRPVRRVAILGDMRELGDETTAAHRQVGELLGAIGSTSAPGGEGGTGDVAETPGNQPKKIDVAIFIGEQMGHAADALARHWPADRIIRFARWSDDLPAQVAGLLRAGDLVLLKASRGMQLERLLPAMEGRFGEKW